MDALQGEAPFRPGHVYNSRIALRPHVAKQLPSSPAGRRYPLSWQTPYKIQPQIPENRGTPGGKSVKIFCKSMRCQLVKEVI